MPPKAQLFRALYVFEIAEADELEMLPGDVIEVSVAHAGPYCSCAFYLFQLPLVLWC